MTMILLFVLLVLPAAAAAASATTVPVIETIVVTDHGVVGDGITDDTTAMRKIFNPPTDLAYMGRDQKTQHCSQRRHIIIPDVAVVLTYPLNITSCTTFQIEGRLVAIPNITASSAWSVLPPLKNYASSEDGYRMFTRNQFHPFIYVYNATDVHITGTGVVDGNGPYFWDLYKHKDPVFATIGGRPNLLQTVYSNNIEIDSVTFKDSPFWTLHPVMSSNIHIHHVTIRAPMYSPNVDGIDPDSCSDVVIEHCDVACGDDHIAIKAGVCGLDSDKRYRNKCTKWIGGSGTSNRPYMTKNVTVRNNIFRTGMGIAIGSEMSGSIGSIQIYNNTIGLCEFGHEDMYHSCGWGPALHIKTTIARSGSIEDVVIEDNTVYNTSMFIALHTDYQVRNDQPLPAGYPKTLIRNITFRNNVVVGQARHAGFECSPFDYCHNITVVNNTIWNVLKGNKMTDDTTPWSCAFIDSYVVHGNYPNGLEECMANSMNQTTSNMVERQETIYHLSDYR